MPLTVTWCVAIGAGKTLGTWNSLTHTVAHVAGWSGPESVDHELAAVPHGDVQLPHAALQPATWATVSGRESPVPQAWPLPMATPPVTVSIPHLSSTRVDKPAAAAAIGSKNTLEI